MLFPAEGFGLSIIRNFSNVLANQKNSKTLSLREERRHCKCTLTSWRISKERRTGWLRAKPNEVIAYVHWWRYILPATNWDITTVNWMLNQTQIIVHSICQQSTIRQSDWKCVRKEARLKAQRGNLYRSLACRMTYCSNSSFSYILIWSKVFKGNFAVSFTYIRGCPWRKKEFSCSKKYLWKWNGSMPGEFDRMKKTKKNLKTVTQARHF